jgi:hypothetical protein
MTAGRTVVVHTRLAGHVARVEAARRKASGVQIMRMEQLAGRLAGGFIQPIEADLSTKRFGIPSRARCRPLRSRARHSAPAGKGPAAAGGNRGNSACEAR